MKKGSNPHHCTGCRNISGPIITEAESEWSCCTCCYDSDGNIGHGRNDGKGW